MSPRATGQANSPETTDPAELSATAEQAPDADLVRIDTSGTTNGDAPVVVSDGITAVTYTPHGGSVRVAAAHVGAILGALTGSAVVDGD
jgi:hypothetical protein